MNDQKDQDMIDEYDWIEEIYNACDVESNANEAECNMSEEWEDEFSVI